MTAICYVGIEVSANFQKILLSIELVMLVVLSVVALVKVGNGSAPAGHLTPSASWLNPFHISTFSAFVSGIILMVFIYWGWDTALSVNEETKDRNRTPGLAAHLLDLHPARHVRAGDLLDAVVRRGRRQGQRPGQPQQCGRRALHPGPRSIRQRHRRKCLLSPAAGDGAVVGRGVDSDHDPANGPHHPVDGRLQGDPEVIREDSPAVPDPDGVDHRHGPDLDRVLRVRELRLERHRRDRRRRHRDRHVHRVLLRPDRVRLRLVLPPEPDQQRAQPVHAGHPALRRRADPLVPRRLVHLAQLRRGHRRTTSRPGRARPALADRRRVRDRRWVPPSSACSSSSTTGSRRQRSSARRP